MYFYLPLPIIVLLFAAVATSVTMTIWASINSRRQVQAIIKQDSKY